MIARNNPQIRIFELILPNTKIMYTVAICRAVGSINLIAKLEISHWPKEFDI